MTRLVANANPLDASICNAFDPPVAGCPSGGGIQITIPPDFAARIAAGQDVPGCSYAHVEPDGSLVVSSVVQAKLANAIQIQSLSPQQQAEAPAFLQAVKASAVTPGQTAIQT